MHGLCAKKGDAEMKIVMDIVVPIDTAGIALEIAKSGAAIGALFNDMHYFMRLKADHHENDAWFVPEFQATIDDAGRSVLRRLAAALEQEGAP